MEHYKNKVDDRSCKVGGTQCITTNDGYVFPMDIRDGLPYLTLRPFTDEEWETLPHVVMTSDEDWDPSVLDNKITDDEEWYNAQEKASETTRASPFDIVGDFVPEEERIPSKSPAPELRRSKRIEKRTLKLKFHKLTMELIPDEINPEFLKTDTCPELIDFEDDDPLFYFDAYEDETQLQVNNKVIKPKEPNYFKFREHFLMAPLDVIKRTFEYTTRMARKGKLPGMNMKKWYRSPFPAFNVRRRNEDVATDTIYANVASVWGGYKAAQVFVGCESKHISIYPMNTDNQFVSVLQDKIRQNGAMDTLISNSAQVEISKKVTEIMRAYVIDDGQSEPYNQHQNDAERRYQVLKTATERTIKRRGAPAYTWLFALLHCAFVHNCMVDQSLGYRTPRQVLTGETTDISPILRFKFWEPVYFTTIKDASNWFPGHDRERRGHYLGISEHVGHYMTYKVFDDATKTVVDRALVRSAMIEDMANLRAEAIAKGHKIDDLESDILDEERIIFGALEDRPDGRKMHLIDKLVGKTFLLQPEEDGTRKRARIIEALDSMDAERLKDPALRRFRVVTDNGKYEEIMAYNEIIDSLEEEDDKTDDIWNYTQILDHEGPLSPKDKNYKGSQWNLFIEWENGERTWEPLRLIEETNRAQAAEYGLEHGLLDQPGWGRLRRIGKRAKLLCRLANQAKLKSYRTARRYKYGYEVPNNHADAMAIDEMNHNTRWADAEKSEISQLMEFSSFEDMGKGAPPSEGYKKIRCHMVYDV